jgi:predicted NBD/HSP70 family sugar kinase
MTTALGTDLAAMRRLNGQAVLTLLWNTTKPMTATQVARATGLSRTTIEAVLAELQAAELVRVDSPRVRGAGRPARGYRFAADRGIVAGLDVGAHSIMGMLGDLRGKPLGEPLRTERDLQGADVALDAIVATVHGLLAATRYSLDDLEAVTIALPGIVDAEGEPKVTTVVPDWLAHGLADRIRGRFLGTHVTFDNDTKLAARAEIERGTVSVDETAIVLRTGQRISAATVVDGRVVRGAHGAAGEIGALERIGWADAYERFSSRAATYPSPRELFEHARAGEPDAVAAVDAFAEDIADGLGALVLAIDPHAVVVTSSIPDASDTITDALRAALPGRTLLMPEVRSSDLGSEGPCRGALARAAEHERARLLEL